MANLPAFKTELLNLFTTTSNLTATEKTKLRNRFVSEYNAQWLTYLADNGGSDTSALRGQFAVEMTVEFWRNIYTAGSGRENLAALPASETLG
jgi:hypothetical protein